MTARDGIRWDSERGQWRVDVSVGGRGARLRARKRFPATATRDEMERWQLRERVRLQDQREAEAEADAPAPPERLTLARCADAYLATVRSMPAYESRMYDLRAWVTALGTRDVTTLTAADVAGVWDGWRVDGRAANTLNHRRTALLECLRLTAPDMVPVVTRGVRWLTVPKDAPRAIPYSLIEEILDAMPISVTQARLRVMAYTGLAPATLRRLSAADVDLQRGTMRLPTRQKGAQVAGVVLPLIPRAIEAFRMLKRMKGWGAYSNQGAAVSWRRAVARVSGRYVEAGQAPLPPLRPYDLRHSFATLVLDATGGDLQATKELLQHADLETTLTYTRARVSSGLQEAAAKVAAVVPSRGPQRKKPPQTAKAARLPKPVRRVRFP